MYVCASHPHTPPPGPLPPPQPVYVRVSAFNGDFSSGAGGYSRPAAGANASTSSSSCDAYPAHCSLTPADQLLWSPVAPTVSLSGLQVP